MRYRRITAMLAASAMIGACGNLQAANRGIEAPASAEVPLVVQVEGSCKDVALTPYCWKQLNDPAGCYFLTGAWTVRDPEGNVATVDYAHAEQ